MLLDCKMLWTVKGHQVLPNATVLYKMLSNLHSQFFFCGLNEDLLR